MIGLGAKGNSQYDATMGLLEIMQDPAKYKAKMQEFATKEKQALDRINEAVEKEKIAKAQTDKATQEIEKLQKMLNDMMVEQKKRDKERVEIDEANAKLDHRAVNLDSMYADITRREREYKENSRRLASAQQRLAIERTKFDKDVNDFNIMLEKKKTLLKKLCE
jgi:hypothetical protein